MLEGINCKSHGGTRDSTFEFVLMKRNTCEKHNTILINDDDKKEMYEKIIPLKVEVQSISQLDRIANNV